MHLIAIIFYLVYFFLAFSDATVYQLLPLSGQQQSQPQQQPQPSPNTVDQNPSFLNDDGFIETEGEYPITHPLHWLPKPKPILTPKPPPLPRPPIPPYLPPYKPPYLPPYKPPPPPYCSISCGSIPATTIVRYNRTNIERGYKAPDVLSISWGGGTVSNIQANIQVNSNGECWAVSGTGKVLSGDFKGLGVSLAYLQYKLCSRCLACRPNGPVSYVKGKAVIAIGTRGVGKWLQCEGIVGTLYSPPLTCDITPAVYRTRWVELTRCVGSC
jgi:hypothetical protein